MALWEQEAVFTWIVVLCMFIPSHFQLCVYLCVSHSVVSDSL